LSVTTCSWHRFHGPSSMSDLPLAWRIAQPQLRARQGSSDHYAICAMSADLLGLAARRPGDHRLLRLPSVVMAVSPGDQLRRRALGTQAVYTVVAIEGDLIVVEVVRAPGLSAGRRLKFTARDAQAMERVPSLPHQPPNPSRRHPFTEAERLMIAAVSGGQRERRRARRLGAYHPRSGWSSRVRSSFIRPRSRTWTSQR
jgi:hypothetical protein